MKPDNSVVVSCHNLSLERGNRTLLRNFDLVLSEGEAVQIVGGNGVGKTSLLRALSGLLPKSQGELIVTNSIFYLAHDNAVKNELTVIENIQWDDRFARQPLEKINIALEYFDLISSKHKLVTTLSQGQRRRLALVKCYLSVVKLYILDEPLAALDQNAIEKFIVLLRNKLTQGAAIVLTSHQPLSGIGISYTIRL